MEQKKNPKSDLQKRSGMFFNLGLVISLGLLLAAFEWKAYDRGNIKELETQENNWPELDIPITIHTPPPPPPSIPLTEITVLPDDIQIDKVDFQIDLNIGEDVPIEPTFLSAPPIEDKADEIKEFVEVQANFVGGMTAWYAYLNKNLTYPTQARRMGIEGTVLVRFVVNTDGSVQDIEIVRSIGGGCDEIAMNVIKNSPKWNAGKHNGKAVRSRMTIPIRFKLN